MTLLVAVSPVGSPYSWWYISMLSTLNAHTLSKKHLRAERWATRPLHPVVFWMYFLMSLIFGMLICPLYYLVLALCDGTVLMFLGRRNEPKKMLVCLFEEIV